MNREELEAWGLASIGFAQGVYKEFIKPEMTAERAIGALGVGISLYELVCPPNEMISHGFDRMIDKHPVATRVAIGYTALHLANLLPEKLDLFSQTSQFIKKQ